MFVFPPDVRCSGLRNETYFRRRGEKEGFLPEGLSRASAPFQFMETAPAPKNSRSKTHWQAGQEHWGRSPGEVKSIGDMLRKNQTDMIADMLLQTFLEEQGGRRTMSRKTLLYPFLSRFSLFCANLRKCGKNRAENRVQKGG